MPMKLFLLGYYQEKAMMYPVKAGILYMLILQSVQDDMNIDEAATHGCKSNFLLSNTCHALKESESSIRPQAIRC